MNGHVSLVGAGPGDPQLLTLKAVSRLKEAELVLYDALVSAELREFAPQARWFYVGKRAGRHSLDQRAIERLMVRAASRGLRVVRLKCGDPFVFGRGGEEALALAEAGVSFDVVPGLSSALAAPALAGMPATHRGLSAAVTIVSGHARSAYGPVLESLAPQSSTLVVLMGLGRRADIAGLLLARGWSGTTPAAVLLDVSHPDESVWRGTLSALGDAPVDSADAAGILVVGEVVSLAASLAPLAARSSGVRSAAL